MTANSPYRPSFEAALRLFARVSEAMKARGCERPILVGGAAAEFYSASAINTGDFDICTPRQEVLEDELQKLGFVRPSGPGQKTRGWIHPDLKLGFEVVTSVPMDGNVDAEHVLLARPVGSDYSFRIISVEDLIADRMGQFASGSANDRIDQARALFALHPEVDLEYLERRIRFKSMGDHGIEDIRS